MDYCHCSVYQLHLPSLSPGFAVGNSVPWWWLRYKEPPGVHSSESPQRNSLMSCHVRLSSRDPSPHRPHKARLPTQCGINRRRDEHVPNKVVLCSLSEDERDSHMERLTFGDDQCPEQRCPSTGSETPRACVALDLLHSNFLDLFLRRQRQTGLKELLQGE